jgi:hypothetical protein
VLVASDAAAARRLVPADYYRLRAVGDVALSPDGASAAYTVRHFDAPGRPSSSLSRAKSRGSGLALSEGRHSRPKSKPAPRQARGAVSEPNREGRTHGR